MSNIKVHELAKELNMTSKDMLDKINSMGIDAKSHMSVLSDIDVISIRNTVLRWQEWFRDKNSESCTKENRDTSR